MGTPGSGLRLWGPLSYGANCQKISQLFVQSNSAITILFQNTVVEILLANTRKFLKFYHFESVRNLASFIALKFIFFTS